MFKKITIFTAICATMFSNSVSAQTATTPTTPTTPTTASVTDISCISKGNFVIGTRFGFSTNKSDVTVEGTNTSSLKSGSQTATQLNISPSLGYFFANRLLVGIGMDYLMTSSSDNSSSTVGGGNSSDSRLLFGPQLRYYFPINSSQSFFFGGVSGFGTSNTEVVLDGKTQKINTNITSFGFGPGYTIFSNNCIAMEAQAKYNFGSTNSSIDISGVKQTTNSKTNAFDFVVGISYYFSR